MPTIHNPVLRGFHPDPSFVRVGEDYYLANSTFEWFSGIPIHHSRDLVHWRLIGHVLTRTSQIGLAGVGDSGGVWAPSLSHHDGMFWIIYTNVRTRWSNFKDIGVFVATAPDILGPWSEPTYLNGIGFDPSLFHDETDGRKWIVNIEWDFRKARHRFAGIVVQELDPSTRRLVGPRHKVLHKQGILTEGPNLYRHDGWVYLMLAEGGTGWNHGISMARSRSVLGPYELDPQASVLTTRDDESIPLQKAGHGEIVQTPSGDWMLAHLASRPLGTGKDRRCPLGRETCLQPVVWSPDGWLRLAHGGWHPRLDVPAPAGLPETPWPVVPERDDFDAATLDASWSSLRTPAESSWLSLTERPGWLRLRGRSSQHALFDQSLVAKRLQGFRATAETCLEFTPKHFTQMAGLICYYDTRQHYYLRVTHDESAGRMLGIVLMDDGNYDELADNQLRVEDWPRCHLRAEIDHHGLQFAASPDGEDWRPVGPVLDMTKLSDDYGSTLRFTGAFVGLCVQDVAGTRAHADFDHFTLRYAPVA